MDARSHLNHDGKKFKKSDILSENRKLLFEGVGTLVMAGAGAAGRGSRSPAPALHVSVVVLSDVMVFLQETNQKYTFVSPEGKSGAVAVHTLIAREKPGADNKALYLLSTSDRGAGELYELTVVQPRDRADWIGGIRRAVDLSTGAPGEENWAESEAEAARRQLEGKFMKMRQLTSELRGKDVALARLLEDKMRVLGEMLEELGVESRVEQPARYTRLVQERDPATAVTKEQLLAEVQEATKLASSLYSSNLGRSVSSVGEHQSEGYESPGLPRRAETFGGFDAGGGKASGVADPVKRKAGEGAAGQLAELGVPATPPILALDSSQQAAAVHMTHYLNNIMCMVRQSTVAVP